MSHQRAAGTRTSRSHGVESPTATVITPARIRMPAASHAYPSARIRPAILRPSSTSAHGPMELRRHRRCDSARTGHGRMGEVDAHFEESDMPDTPVSAVLSELGALEDPRMREVNERHGDDHGVNLTKLRGVAKSLKTDHDLALALWATDDTAARLVALLICRPKSFTAGELDAMLREARARKVHDWLINYVVKKSPHVEPLRVAWLDDPDPVVASAGWALTADAVAKHPELVDLPGLLDTIEARDEDGAGPASVGDEQLPCRDRHPSSCASCPRDRYRRAPRSAQGLPDTAQLHLAFRPHLDRRDRPPAGRSVGTPFGTVKPVPPRLEGGDHRRSPSCVRRWRRRLMCRISLRKRRVRAPVRRSPSGRASASRQRAWPT